MHVCKCGHVNVSIRLSVAVVAAAVVAVVAVAAVTAVSLTEATAVAAVATLAATLATSTSMALVLAGFGSQRGGGVRRSWW